MELFSLKKIRRELNKELKANKNENISLYKQFDLEEEIIRKYFRKLGKEIIDKVFNKYGLLVHPSFDAYNGRVHLSVNGPFINSIRSSMYLLVRNFKVKYLSFDRELDNVGVKATFDYKELLNVRELRRQLYGIDNDLMSPQMEQILLLNGIISGYHKESQIMHQIYSFIDVPYKERYEEVQLEVNE